MKYSEAYQLVFRSPKWLQNLLICGIAPLVPIAGAMVVIGYQFEILETLHLRRKEGYPDFDFNRLLPYLLRGAWPVLVQLIVGLPVGLLLAIGPIVCYFGFFFCLTSRADPSWTALWGVLFGCSLLLSALVNAVVTTFVVPMFLRAGLMQDFGAAFSWAFVRDFLRRLWGKTLLAELFLVLTGTPLVMVGLLLCYVGVFPATALIQFARTYLLYELYEEYLARGGEEIPLQVQPVRAVPEYGYEQD